MPYQKLGKKKKINDKPTLIGKNKQASKAPNSAGLLKRQG